MNWPFPLSAPEISVEWHKEECGLGVTAYTDEAGLPYIGLYQLDFEGIPCGQPIYFQRQRLMADVLIGLNNLKPVVVYIDADISARGLDVRLCLPLGVIGQKEPRHLWAHWDR